VIAAIIRFAASVHAALPFGGELGQVFYFAAGAMLIYGSMSAVPIVSGS
jgi:hypothetical protein